MTTSAPNTSKGNAPPPAAAAPAAPKKRQIPAGLVNLSERYPQYEPGIDARDIKKNYGKDANVLHGYLLAELTMPATIADDETGEFKPWIALCFELIEPCEGRFQDENNPDRVETRMVPKGGKMIVTKTTAMQTLFERGLSRALQDPDQVYECYIVPQASKTKNGRALWIFPECYVGNPIKRETRHMVALPSLPEPKQLGSGDKE
jgi:hypothetical protein